METRLRVLVVVWLVLAYIFNQKFWSFWERVSMARTKPGTWTRRKDSWRPRRQTGSRNWKRKLPPCAGGLETERLWRSWNGRENSSYSASPAAMEKKTATAVAPPFQGSLLTPWAAETAYAWGSPRRPKISLRIFYLECRRRKCESFGGFISGYGKGWKMSCSQNRRWRKDSGVKRGNEWPLENYNERHNWTH